MKTRTNSQVVNADMRSALFAWASMVLMATALTAPQAHAQAVGTGSCSGLIPDPAVSRL
jgi:hypothetical protein